MRKTLTYSGFGIVSLAVIAVFVTSKSYTQLGSAVLLYPLLVYFAYELFFRQKFQDQEAQLPPQPPPVNEVGDAEIVTTEATREHLGVVDIDKRAFLKLIGVAGLSFFLFSIISRKSESLFFGKAVEAADTTSLEDTTGAKIDPSERQPMDGYRISEIDDNESTFYGFINKNGAWFIMKEDSDSSSFRYTKGDVNFPSGWTGRERLKYDYYHNVFS